jgi:hypothetical protein
VTPGAASVNPDEAAKLVELLEQQIQQEHSPPTLKRDAHPKMHGCVQAELVVDESVSPELRHGVFAEPKTFRAWVRFSNAFRIQHDLEFETRGMGIKLLDVPGDKLSPDEKETQDFLLATHDAFFLPTADGYVELIRAISADPPAPWGFFKKRHLTRAGIQMLRSAVVLVRSPLAIPYFSQTPFRLGPDMQVKLQARPRFTPALRAALPAKWVFACQAIGANLKLQLNQKRADEDAAQSWCDRYLAHRDFLRLGMMDFLSRHDAAFDLMVQTRTDEDRMPIDDATVSWPQSKSRFQKVATLKIPRQVFWPGPGLSKELRMATERMIRLGEDMSFNPWHSLEAHEPLGSINGMRRKVYSAIADFRRKGNHVEVAEPLPSEYDELKQLVQHARA